MKKPCLSCGANDYFATRSTVEGIIACSECSTISVRYTPPHVKKQQEGREKDLIQPYKYDKQEKKTVPNKDFERVYGKEKAKRFDQTLNSQANFERQKSTSLEEAVKNRATPKSI